MIAYRNIPETDPAYIMLRKAGYEVDVHNRLGTAAAPALARCEGLIVGLQRIDDPLMARMPRCRVISRLGVGYDNIDVPAATARGIQVTYVPDYGVHEVSTHAIALMLVMARNMGSLLRASNEGRWDYSAMGVMQRLQDQTLGVAGFGRIGRETAKKGKGLGMTVIVHDPVVPATGIQALGMEPVDMDTLLDRADYLSLHVPSSPATRHLIDARALARMKDTARIINTARGPLIDEDALLAALRAGTIAGAALDVFTTEPPPADHPLLHEPNVIVTPHAAWYSEAAQHDLRTGCAQDVINVLSGRKPVHPLNEV